MFSHFATGSSLSSSKTDHEMKMKVTETKHIERKENKIDISNCASRKFSSIYQIFSP